MKWCRTILFFLLDVAITIRSSSSSEEALRQCRANGATKYRKFATKTPYTYIVDSLDEDNSTSSGGHCEPVQFWTIVRHGTRYPSKEAINFLNKELPKVRDSILSSGRSKLCAGDLEALRNWQPDIDVELAKDLHPEGELEMILLAERFQKRFPRLLGEDYHPEEFLFRATDKQRAQLSGRSYATGLFTKPVANKVDIAVLPESPDPLIRFYKLCYKWISEVKKNPAAKAEFHKFSQSEWIQAVRRNVTEFLGLLGSGGGGDEEEELLSLTTVEQIYIACIFYQAWHPGINSPWCAAFGDQELEVMEYREDLENFYMDGPAFEITYKQACILFNDLFANFLNVTKGEPAEERGIFYFSHAGTIQKLLAFLQLYKEEEEQLMTSDGYAPGRDWAWRTSRISPFGANLAFLLRQCGGTGQDQQQDQFQVGLYVNERLVRLPGCDSSWCDWSEFSRLFGPAATTDCQFSEICSADLQPGDSVELADDKY